MSRKVFISFLGTNNYVECKYNINGENSTPVRFIQEALIEQLCQDWTAEDRIFIFCTSKETTGENGSKEINWLDNGQARVSDESEKIGLKRRLQDLQSRLGLQAPIEQFDIDAGFSEDEIWNIFNTVYGKLLPNDEIHFDVTHAFRSIPLFSIVLFNYSKFMLGTQLKTIYYGAFEKLGPAFKVKELPVEQRIAPVIDLTNIARLQEYNQIASGLKDFGKVKPLKDAIVTDDNALPDYTIANLRKSISELDEYIATINLKEIKKGAFITNFRNNLKNVNKRKQIIKPIRNMLDELYRETEDFVSQNDYRNIEAAINWTIKHDMLMQVYPLAAEYIILRVSDRNSSLLQNYHMYDYISDQQERNRKFREFVGGVLGAPDDVFNQKNWNSSSFREYRDAADELANDNLVVDIRPLYNPIRNVRNKLVHGNGFEYCILQNTIPQIQACIGYLRENDNR